MESLLDAASAVGAWSEDASPRTRQDARKSVRHGLWQPIRFYGGNPPQLQGLGRPYHLYHGFRSAGAHTEKYRQGEILPPGILSAGYLFPDLGRRRFGVAGAAVSPDA